MTEGRPPDQTRFGSLGPGTELCPCVPTPCYREVDFPFLP